MTKMKVDDAMEERAFIHASNFFLCAEVPADWFELSECEQETFIRDNAWEPLENMPVEDVVDLIDSAKLTTLSFMKKEGIVK